MQFKISGCTFLLCIVEGRVVDSNMDASLLPWHLFAVLVYYLGAEDVASGVVVGNAVFVNCTDVMIIVFFYYVFQASVGLFYVRKVAIFVWVGPFVDYALY